MHAIFIGTCSFSLLFRRYYCLEDKHRKSEEKGPIYFVYHIELFVWFLFGEVVESCVVKHFPGIREKK